MTLTSIISAALGGLTVAFFRDMRDRYGWFRRRPAPVPSHISQEQCKTPPAGWQCTRAAGHEGPCAAISKAEQFAQLIEKAGPIEDGPFSKDGVPLCRTCGEEFQFDQNEPFAHCRCGTSEWGHSGDPYRRIQAARHTVKCNECQGRGRKQYENGDPDKCWKCHGSGKLPKECETCNGRGYLLGDAFTDNPDPCSTCPPSRRRSVL